MLASLRSRPQYHARDHYRGGLKQPMASNLARSSRTWMVLGTVLCALLWNLRSSGQDWNVSTAPFGSPLPDISAQEFEQFCVGLEDFLEVEEPEDGLGPVFNGRSCAECHN